MMKHKQQLHAFELDSDDDAVLPLAPDEDLDPGDTRSDDAVEEVVAGVGDAPSEDAGATWEDNWSATDRRR